ncbi:MAG: futalosine hydrolase [Desulfonatronovibrionaceae bacterium]
MLLVTAATKKELAAFLGTGDVLAKTVVNGREVFCLSTGVGVINAASTLSAFLQSHPVSAVLNVGIAGSLDPNRLALGDLALADREIWPELGIRTDTGLEMRRLNFPLVNLQGKEIYETLDLDPVAGAGWGGVMLPPDWPRETFLTVSGVSGTRRMAAELRDRYSAKMENMEGFALAFVSAKLDIPFLEVRSVSNVAGSREKKDWDFPRAFKSLHRAGVQMFARF